MIVTERQMVCSQCGEKSDWFDAAITGLVDMIAELRGLGWKRGRHGRMSVAGDLCPGCSGKKPKEKN